MLVELPKNSADTYDHIRDMVGEFAREQIRPHAARIDQEEEFPVRFRFLLSKLLRVHHYQFARPDSNLNQLPGLESSLACLRAVCRYK